VTQLYLANFIQVRKSNWCLCHFPLEKTALEIGTCLGGSLGLTLDNTVKITTKLKFCEKVGTMDEGT